jgi:sialate O-acetylesterase
MNHYSKTFFVLLIGCCIQTAVHAQIKLPAIIGDNMVLQRGITAPVWGWALPEDRITLTFRNKEYKVSADRNGKWMVKLSAHTAPDKSSETGGPFDMLIRSRNDSVRLKNILVGDTWLASGQSNMEFGIQTDSRAAETIANATDSLIHFFYVPMAASLQPEENIGAVPNGSLNGRWLVCSPAIMAEKWAWHGFSAIGYYFAREIRRTTGCPIGMIASYKGGTPAQAWMSLSGLQRDTAFAHYIRLHQKLVDSYTQAQQDSAASVSKSQTPKPPNGGFGAPANLYHAMIAPLIPYAIKGVIWYQGESNGDKLADAVEYNKLFPALITDWREKWSEGNFPFLFVQLTNFRTPAGTPSEGIWPWVREAQLKTLRLPKTGMAVITDVGDAKDIHPKDKLDPGVRLALAARHVAYGEDNVYSGPVYQSMTVKGNSITLGFDHCGSGLVIGTSPTQELKGFGIAGADGKFVWARAVIKGNTVVISSDEIATPVAVRYNWADNPPGNLYNKEGLPASPFRTDNWPAIPSEILTK